MSVKQNLLTIEKNIKAACERSDRNPEDITIIGVTKYVTIERAKEAVETGIINLGENRTDEFLNKYHKIDNESVNWHFIGTLQSRKAREIINEVAVIHSLDRLSLARQINNRSDRTIDCFVQVNVSGEASKHGLEPEEVMTFIEQLAEFEKVNVVGLMTMAPHIDDENELRQVFRRLAKLRDDIQAKEFSHAPCDKLSMGMSNDYEIAIEEGATHIRIGSSLVGS